MKHVRERIRSSGLDLVRLTSVILVAWQHAVSVSGASTRKIFFELDAGQFGVACFLAISGFFILQGKPRPTLEWLKHRLMRVAIPYWIVLTAMLLANSIVQYKPMPWNLILSQYTFTGLWTHGDYLIGVHFWFLHLLAALYIAAAVIRTHPNSVYLFLLLTLSGVRWNPWLAGHAMAFFTGIIFQRYQSSLSRYREMTSFITLTIMAQLLSPAFAAPAVSVAILSVALAPNLDLDRCKKTIDRCVNYSYEFYLVHAPIFLAVSKYMSNNLFIIMSVGTSTSIFSAIFLGFTQKNSSKFFHALKKNSLDSA